MSVLVLEASDECPERTNKLRTISAAPGYHALLIDAELDQQSRELVRIYHTMREQSSNEVRPESGRHWESEIEDEWRVPGAWISDADTAIIQTATASTGYPPKLNAEDLLRELLRTLEPVLVKVGAALAAHDGMHHRQDFGPGT